MLGLLFLLFILVLCAHVAAIYLFIQLGDTRNKQLNHRGMLWFIGLCVPLGAIVVGLYISALPEAAPVNDLGGGVYTSGATPLPSSEELPKL